MKGFLETVDLVKNDRATVDEAYQLWKNKYPDEFRKLSETAKGAWNIFRLAVSKAVGRGIYYNEYRHNRGKRPTKSRSMTI
jgi:hypothetical protein